MTVKLNGLCQRLTIWGLRLKQVLCNLIEPVGHKNKRKYVSITGEKGCWMDL